MTNAEARFNKIHIRKVYACLAVTCHLHFWQNDRDFLRATVVTRGWNGYRNKSQHRKSTLEKKILPPFQQGFEPATFQSRVRCSNHWAIPAPIPWLHFQFLNLASLAEDKGTGHTQQNAPRPPVLHSPSLLVLLGNLVKLTSNSFSAHCCTNLELSFTALLALPSN